MAIRANHVALTYFLLYKLPPAVPCAAYVKPLSAVWSMIEVHADRGKASATIGAGLGFCLSDELSFEPVGASAGFGRFPLAFFYQVVFTQNAINGEAFNASLILPLAEKGKVAHVATLAAKREAALLLFGVKSH